MAQTPQAHDHFPRKFGKYHLLGPLAQGGMGALYLAVTGDRGLERLTVIKTVLPHLADSEYVARFRDEAKIVVRLSHGNLIPVFDAGQVDGELFLAMDYVEGKDLRAVWNACASKQVAFPIDIAVFIAKELARGLDFAHSFEDLELVHRDVSPPNVIVSYAGEVKLTDFGLASSTMKIEKTAPGIIYGKVAYMSPEQARGEPLDGRSDLYAAGIILWELLTGRQLFPPSKEQPKDLMARAKNPEVAPPSARAPRVPADLDAICLRALAPQREDRFATGEELREALAGWLAKEAPATDSSRLGKFVRELFREQIERDRSERQRLIEAARDRARNTMPPTDADELRRLLDERAGLAGGGDAAGGASDPGPLALAAGRRKEDRGEVPRDRRRVGGGRRDDDSDGERAVEVPKPGRGGSTVIRSDTASGALALRERQESEPAPAVEHAAHELIGAIIGGRYRVLELLGEGGMGRVFMAEHTEIGKRVALKVLHPVYSRMPELVERFRREARAASRIGHPHIVDVTDSGSTSDDQVYFVMEYLDGVELASVIDREGALPLGRALRIAAQICRALAAAHAVGVIHRDLKPENVFLTLREGTSDFVKVLDFGIAKSAEAEEARSSRLTHPGMAMGTPEYMAPEQAAGKPADARTDVYAVGAILYEMLTGEPPYRGDNFMEILAKKATVDPRPPRELRDELDAEVEALVLRAMARDPGLRPPSMESFEYELTKCMQGRGAAVAQALGMRLESAESFEGRGLVDRSSPPSGVARPAPATGRLSSASPIASSVSPSAVVAAARSAGELGVETASLAAAQSSRRTRWWWMLLAFAVALGVVTLLVVAVRERAAREADLAAAPAVVVEASAEEPAAAEAPVATPAAVADPVRATAGRRAVLTGAPARGVDAPVVAEAPAPQRGDGVGEGAASPGDGARDETTTAEPDADDGSAADADDDSAADAADDSAADARRADARTNKRPPSNAREAAELLREARRLEATLEWSRARANYQRVARGRYRKASGLLGLAKVAFETRDVDGAIRYAEQALAEGGGDDAKMQLGHAYFKQGNYPRAIAFYEQVLAARPDNREAQTSLDEARRRLGQ